MDRVGILDLEELDQESQLPVLGYALCCLFSLSLEGGRREYHNIFILNMDVSHM